MSQPFLFNILLVVGVLALIIWFVLYQVQTLAWLRHHGRRIVATITSIRHETKRTRSGYMHENYYLTARWTNPQTGRTYSFWAWSKDSDMGYRPGSLVPVLVDPGNPRHYVVEL